MLLESLNIPLSDIISNSLRKCINSQKTYFFNIDTVYIPNLSKQNKTKNKQTNENKCN